MAERAVEQDQDAREPIAGNATTTRDHGFRRHHANGERRSAMAVAEAAESRPCTNA
jgi:hypothetical protein